MWSQRTFISLNTKKTLSGKKLAKGLKSKTEKNNEDRKLLQELLEENNKKIREVEENFQHQKEKIKKKEEILKCDECGETFLGKINLRNHIKHFHPKNICCDICDLIYHERWEYEKQLNLIKSQRTTNVKCVEKHSFWSGA